MEPSHVHPLFHCRMLSGLPPATALTGTRPRPRYGDSPSAKNSPPHSTRLTAAPRFPCSSPHSRDETPPHAFSFRFCTIVPSRFAGQQPYYKVWFYELSEKRGELQLSLSSFQMGNSRWIRSVDQEHVLVDSEIPKNGDRSICPHCAAGPRFKEHFRPSPNDALQTTTF